ncbi:hypothetical protein ALC60_08019 [Trachymyrmex zeteki]|uniref:Uncharacterized protein n=1 Tax=Mycetomoellerius zeteki TaxID=64791 RepID=A0A151WY60_9HYME|nr:hypothetical protein ALC60_08019 [Trachymyrmex zeteki]
MLNQESHNSIHLQTADFVHYREPLVSLLFALSDLPFAVVLRILAERYIEVAATYTAPLAVGQLLMFVLDVGSLANFDAWRFLYHHTEVAVGRSYLRHQNASTLYYLHIHLSHLGAAGRS